MLPYTPLHHLLLADARRAAGDDVRQPVRRADRLSRTPRRSPGWRGIADLFLLPRPRDRDALRRLGGARRSRARRSCCAASRGYVPRAIAIRAGLRRAGPRLRRAAEEHVLHRASDDSACSGRTSAISKPRDLRDYRGRDRAHGAIPRRPPGLGRARPAPRTTCRRDMPSARPGVRQVAVQHHHAHVASADGGARHRRTRDRRRLRRHRLRHRRHRAGAASCCSPTTPRVQAPRDVPAAAAGRRRRARSVSRGALRWRCCDDAFRATRRSTRSRCSRRSPRAELDVVTRCSSGASIRRARAASAATSTRFGALLLGRRRRATKARSRSSWNMAASRGEPGRYRSTSIDATDRGEIDLRPTVQRRGGRPAGGVAPAHDRGAVSQHAGRRDRGSRPARPAARGRLPVVLTGGCFQNARLAEGSRAALRADRGLPARGVPPGDGGIALGQA